MDGQQQFLKPAQHVPFYVKRAITIDTSSHPHLYGYENGLGKPASYSVDLSYSRFSRPRHIDQLSEPYTRPQSRSLRDVFEKAILSGDVAIHSPDDDNGVMRNPSFITASLPRPDKHKQKSATIGGDNYLHIGKNHKNHGRSTDYFVDSSSESESESGQHNDAYLDDASSTISDELFKSTSEGQVDNQVEEDFHIQPLPQLLDIDSHQAGRSALGGFFKPKYRDYPRNNVHRTSERQHKEAIDCGTSRHSKRGNSLHRGGPNSLHRDESLHRDGALIPLHNGRTDTNKDIRKLPRTKFPIEPSQELDASSYHRESRDGSHSPQMSHNKYLPKKRRLSRPHSPRLSLSRRETVFNDLDDIFPIRDSPQTPRRHPRSSLTNQSSGEGRLTAQGAPLEQMEVEDPPWRKAEIREMRRRRRRKICFISLGFTAFLLIGGIAAALVYAFGGFAGMKTPTSNVGSSVGDKTTTAQAVVTTTPKVITLTTPATQDIHLPFGLTGSMRVMNEQYDSELADLSSSRSMNLSTRFCDTMDNVFAKNSTDYQYLGCNVTGFENGSIIIEFQLDFLTADNSSTSDDCETRYCPKVPSARDIKNILLERFESTSQNGSDWFQIDQNSTRLGKRDPLPKPSPEPQTTQPPTLPTTTTQPMTEPRPEAASTVTAGHSSQITTVGDFISVSTTSNAITTATSTSSSTSTTTTTASTTATSTTTTTERAVTDCASIGKEDRGKYPDTTNCTRFYTCYDNDDDHKWLSVACNGNSMFEVTDAHSGQCTSCNRSICDKCRERYDEEDLPV